MNRTLCIAPMMDRTHKHFRYFMRLLCPSSYLYTEMVTTGALLFGDQARHLDFNVEEHPVALQLGGSDPADLALCARLAEEWGYDEVNLNVGCPSDRVQHGKFGACLMNHPGLVAECVSAMKSATTLPVTVKTRIGVDDNDSFEALCDFVKKLQVVGTDALIVHARKAWLQGLSPRENREIPPLKYEVVYELKRLFSSLEIIINGGIKTVDAVQAHLNHVDGVMVGRVAYQDPYRVAEMGGNAPSRVHVVKAYLPYIAKQLSAGERLPFLIQPLLTLFNGMPNAKTWRRLLTVNSYQPGADIHVIEEALTNVV